MPPSFLALRAIPTLANLLALPVGFWFVRRLYGRTAAWIFSIALAILPTAIAHSRICQDPSQSILWTGIVIYLSLLGLAQPGRAWFYLAGALLLFPVVLWTHPTNIFIAPFLVLPFVAATRPLLPASRSGRTALVIATALLVILGVFVVDRGLRHLAGLDDYLDKPWLLASARLTDGAQMFEFAANNARLFNGVTIYHYFSGARPTTWPYDAGVVILVCAALSGFLPDARTRTIAGGRGAAPRLRRHVARFYAFAGPQALRPHAERWGLCLIVPAVLVFARGLAAWIEWKPRMRWLTIGTLTLAATSLLASFYVNFFREFATTGGRSHLAYVTAPTEPKQQALDRILAASPGPGRVTIVAQQWWLCLADRKPRRSAFPRVGHQGSRLGDRAGARRRARPGPVVLRGVRRHVRACRHERLDPRSRPARREHSGPRRGRPGPSRDPAGDAGALEHLFMCP